MAERALAAAGQAGQAPLPTVAPNVGSAAGALSRRSLFGGTPRAWRHRFCLANILASSGPLHQYHFRLHAHTHRSLHPSACAHATGHQSSQDALTAWPALASCPKLGLHQFVPIGCRQLWIVLFFKGDRGSYYSYVTLGPRQM